MRGVARVDATDGLAVGDTVPSGSGRITKSWTNHITGSPPTNWALETGSPSNPGSDNHLQAATVRTSSDLWVAGYYQGNSVSLPYRAMTLRRSGYNGSWTSVSTPNVSTYSNYLFGISAVDPDIWAVGYYHTGSHFYTLIMRYTVN